MMSVHRAVHPFLFTFVTLSPPLPSLPPFRHGSGPPCSLSPLTYLHLLHPTIPPPPSICLPGPPTHFTPFLSEALLSRSLLPSLLLPIISAVCVSIPLVLCHSLPTPPTCIAGACVRVSPAPPRSVSDFFSHYQSSGINSFLKLNRQKNACM